MNLEEGYKWVPFKGVSIPRPEKWFKFTSKDIYVFFVELVAQTGVFQTGVTLQVYRNLKKTYKGP